MIRTPNTAMSLLTSFEAGLTEHLPHITPQTVRFHNGTAKGYLRRWFEKFLIRRDNSRRQGAVVMSKSCPNPIAEKRPKRLTLSEIRPVPRRGLSRIESAVYIGVSPSKFDEMVSDGRMPKPKRVDGRKLWDIRELDLAFDGLPEDAEVHDDTWRDFGQPAVKR